MNQKRGLGDYVALGALILTLFGSVLVFYGRFMVMEARMDEADRDRHEMMANQSAMQQQLDRIENAIAHIGDGILKDGN